MMKSSRTTTLTSWKQTWFQLFHKPYHLYHAGVSCIGLLLCAWGLVYLLNGDPKEHLLLLIVLAAVSAITTTSALIADDVSITYTIGPAVGMSAVPFFGPQSAVIINAVHTIVLWIVKPADQTTWKKSWSQLSFNIGMHTIAIVLAGWVLLLLRGWMGGDTLLGQTVPWFIAAYVYEELNFWLLAGILRLQHGESVHPIQMWREDYWATQIGVLVTACGSGILAYALQRYDWIGITIFFLPSVLSAYAFRLYVRRMQAHLDNLEHIVAERTKELAELNQQKDAYLAVLTHDMVTPLTSIQMYAELIRDEPEIVLNSPELIHIMLRSQQAVRNLVNNILDIEKLASGGSLSTHKTQCDLGQLIADTIGIVQPEATQKNIELHQYMHLQPIPIFADQEQMQRILLNLISNAIKYTPAGGCVKVQTNLEEDRVRLSVIDTGYGIPDEALPHIFDRYKRVDQLKGKATGTGLGLAITKALVAEHHGEISVSSELGKGSTFTVSLPVC